MPGHTRVRWYALDHLALLRTSLLHRECGLSRDRREGVLRRHAPFISVRPRTSPETSRSRALRPSSSAARTPSLSLSCGEREAALSRRAKVRLIIQLHRFQRDKRGCRLPDVTSERGTRCLLLDTAAATTTTSRRRARMHGSTNGRHEDRSRGADAFSTRVENLTRSRTIPITNPHVEVDRLSLDSAALFPNASGSRSLSSSGGIHLSQQSITNNASPLSEFLFRTSRPLA